MSPNGKKSTRPAPIKRGCSSFAIDVHTLQASFSAMAPASRTSHRPLVIKAAVVSRVHTYLAYSAFLVALFLGCLFHYKKIVKNGVAGYPEEWFPSVSAT